MINGADIRPLFARVLLHREKAQKIGNVYIPSTVEKKHAALKCKVLAKGPAADEQITIGAIVLVGRHAGEWINKDGKPLATEDDAEFYICQDEDIIAELPNG